MSVRFSTTEIPVMLSHSRHIRSVARTVSLLVASTVLAAAAAQASETAHVPMVLTAYSNGAGGETLLKGDYTQAVTEIKRYRPQEMVLASAKATNLCVAYAASKQVSEAKAACDEALKQAKYDRLSASRFALNTSLENGYVAIAYANRAVVHMLARDAASAKIDLDKARVLAPNADFVAKNAEAVAAKSAPTIAQVQISPSR
jgi:hypothetical protein